MRAKRGCSLGDEQMLHERAAVPAGQTAAAIGKQFGLVATIAAVSVHVVAQRRSAGSDGPCKGCANGLAEAGGLFAGQGIGRAQWMDAGAYERLVGVVEHRRRRA